MNRRETNLRETGDQWRYDYNLRGELTSGAKARSAASDAPLCRGLQFGYEFDLIGNRIAETVDTPSGAETIDWTPNAANQIVEREHPSGQWMLGRVHPDAALTNVVGGGEPAREGGDFDRLGRSIHFPCGNNISCSNSGSWLRSVCSVVR